MSYCGILQNQYHRKLQALYFLNLIVGPNDHVLYQQEYENAYECSMYKSQDGSGTMMKQELRKDSPLRSCANSQFLDFKECLEANNHQRF